MLQNTAHFAPLFTFAPVKLEACLSDQKKKKFPFLRKGKFRPITSLFKIKTLENQCQKEEQQLATIKTEENANERCYRNFGSFAEIPHPQNEEEIEKIQQVSNPQKLKSSRINLPSVFDRKFPPDASKKQKRSISSQHEARNLKEGRSATIENKNRYGQEEGYCETIKKKLLGLENKVEKESHLSKWNQIAAQKQNRRISYAPDIAAVDSSLIQGIRRMKKIYN